MYLKIIRYIFAISFVLAILTSSVRGEQACSNILSRVSTVFSQRAGEELGVSAAELARLKKAIPSKSIMRLAARISEGQYAVIYETDDLSEPDSRVLVIRDGQVKAEFAMRSLAKRGGEDLKWRTSFKAANYAWVCTDDKRVLYVNFQTGNSGGFFVGIVEEDREAVILPLGDVAQGRLIISSEAPLSTELWDVAPNDRDLCTGCPKHYGVQSLEVRGRTKITTGKRETRKTYDGDEFQEHPIKLVPRLSK